MRKLLPIMPLLLGLATAGCASDTTGTTLKNDLHAGVAACDAGDYAKAYKIWCAMDDDDIAARRNVAMMRRQCLGTTKDPSGAEDMYLRAADAGVHAAQADLADILIRGEAGEP